MMAGYPSAEGAALFRPTRCLNGNNLMRGDLRIGSLLHQNRRIAILDKRVVVSATAVLWSLFMARMVKCIKLGREAEGLDFPSYPGELGKRIFDNVSKEAWKQWLEHQKMLVNENRLNLADKKARDYLVQQMEKYFFGSGADVAAGYIPPSQK